MTYDPNVHHRRSVRLPGYDYTQPGGYFITVCTHDRACLFGEVVDGEMHLNELGHIVTRCWHDLPSHYPNVELDVFVVMPNHVHGVLILTDVGISDADPPTNVGAGLKPAPTVDPQVIDDAHPNTRVGAGLKPAPTVDGQVTEGIQVRHGVPEIVRAFKTFSARRVNQVRSTPGTPLWQRNYYEHIIRNDRSLDEIREYILNNPAAWDRDPERV